MKKAVIFDMDGLMLNTESLNFACYSEMLAEHHITMSQEFYTTLLGKTVKHAFKAMEDEYGVHFELEQALLDVQQRMERIYKEKGVEIKKGLIELLEYLKENQYKTIVATSSHRERLNELLNNAHIIDYFDDFICGDEVKQSKPHPDIFLNACQKLNVSTDEALVLEDSEAGILAAYRGHIDVICIPDMKYPEEEYVQMTTCILDSLDLVIDFLL